MKISKNFNWTDCQKYNSASSYAKKSLIDLITFESKPFQFWIQSKQRLPIQPIIIYNFDCFDFSWPVLLSNSFINSHATFQETEYGVILDGWIYSRISRILKFGKIGCKSSFDLASGFTANLAEIWWASHLGLISILAKLVVKS